ncbi:S8 family peptidase [bacterium]|nr:S8 family peptidase [bacterium]
MKHFVLCLTLGCLLVAGAVQAAPSLLGDKLMTEMQQADADELIHVLVLMSPEPDGQAMMNYVQGVRASDRATLVWDALKTQADVAQSDMLDMLYDYEQDGSAEHIRQLVMGNSVDAWVKPHVIRAITRQHSVRKVVLLEEQQVIPRQEERPASGQLEEIDWGVLQIDAPDVWDMGYTGEGVVVGVMDTGCNWNHLDLVTHMWDGGATYPNHGYDFSNNDDNPMDGHGHGTHVSGTVASDGSAGSQCGVAPNAQIMALKVLSDGGSGSYANVWAALDFALANGADVVTMSAGWHSVDATSRSTFREHYVLLNAANIVSTNSAGNDGGNMSWYPIPDNIKTPASVPPPWINPETPGTGEAAGQITVGSTDTNDGLSYFSSRGPVTWENESPWFDWVYANGSQDGLMKPDVSAPGEDIKSCDYNNTSGYTLKSGTSMATPHVAGLCALLKSISIDLSPAEINEILETTAIDMLDPGKDNDSGAGRVDAVAAAQMAESFLTDIQVHLVPAYDPPYIIPGSGGTLYFAANIGNNYTTTTPGQIRTLVILPNGNEYPLDTYNVNFQPGVDINAPNASQFVPGMAPTGIYSYVARAGTTPWTLVDEDSFEFRKFNFSAESLDNEWTRSDWFEVAADDADIVNIPGEYSLGVAYPNPFNPTTTVAVNLPETVELTVHVYNVTGQIVATLANGSLNAGQHQLVFDGANLSSGLYFIHASVPGQLDAIQKVTLMK